MPLSPGETLKERYRVVRLLGQGGFGAVYRAWDVQMEGPCALKENLATSTAAQRQFEREAKLLYKLRHPNLPRVFDHFLIPDQGQYLVMDYIEGEDLKSMLQRVGGPLPQSEVLDWILQVCDALVYLHARTPPVIHRDIKPANIRITPHGEAILVDFGIAKVSDPGGRTTTGAQAYSPGYSPPEQYGLESTDARSDVFALGATTYHLLTGMAPPSAMDVMAGVVAEPLPAHQLNPAISPTIGTAVAEAMRFKRDERLESAAHFQEALRAGLAPHGETVIAPRSPITAPETLIVKRPGSPPPTGTAPSTPRESTPSVDESQPPAPAPPTPEIAPSVPRESTPMEAESQAALHAGPPRVAPQASPMATTPSLARESAPRVPARRNNLARWGIGALVLVALAALGVWGWNQFFKGDIGYVSTTQTALAQAAATATRALATPTPKDSDTPGPLRTAQPTLPPLGSPPAGALKQIVALVGTPLPDQRAPITQGNAARVRHIARWGKGVINQAAWSPDGDLLAVAATTGIYLYDAGSLAETLYIPSVEDVISLAFFADGDILATGSSTDAGIKLWRVKDGKPVKVLEGHTAGVTSLAVSPDGRVLASGSYDGTLRIWKITDLESLYTLQGDGQQVKCVAFSPDGNILASGHYDGSVRLWRVTDGENLGMLEGHTETVQALAFAPGGDMLASGAWDSSVRLWSLPDGELQDTLEGTGAYGVDSLSFSPDGGTLAIGWGDGKLDLWNTAAGEPDRTLDAHSGRVLSLGFSPDGEFLLSASLDGQVRLWRTESYQLADTLLGYNNLLFNVAFSPDGEMLAIGTGNGTVELRQFRDGSPERSLEVGNANVQALAFSPDGETLAASPSNNIYALLWRTANGELLHSLEGLNDGISALAFSPDGDLLAGGAYGGDIHLWRTEDWEVLRSLEGHDRTVASLAFSQDGKGLASGSWDNTVRVWQVSNGSLLQKLEAHENYVSSVDFSPDGKVLASGSWDGSVKLWRIPDGKLLHSLEVEEPGATSLAFSPDGGILASGWWDNKVRLWRVSDGVLLATLEGHSGSVQGVAFSPDGRFLVSVGYDGTVRVWGVIE